MKLVPESKLRKLLLESECLRRLEAGGVDNWVWYKEALSEDGNLEDWEETYLNKLLDEYESLEHYIEFNY